VFEVGEEILRSALYDDPAYRWASSDEFAPVHEKSACMVAGAGFVTFSQEVTVARSVRVL
jgi:hypothetical protein